MKMLDDGPLTGSDSLEALVIRLVLLRDVYSTGHLWFRLAATRAPGARQALDSRRRAPRESISKWASQRHRLAIDEQHNADAGRSQRNFATSSQRRSSIIIDPPSLPGTSVRWRRFQTCGSKALPIGDRQGAGSMGGWTAAPWPWLQLCREWRHSFPRCVDCTGWLLGEAGAPQHEQ